MHEGVGIDCGRITDGPTPKLTEGSTVGMVVALIDGFVCRATARTMIGFPLGPSAALG